MEKNHYVKKNYQYLSLFIYSWNNQFWFYKCLSVLLRFWQYSETNRPEAQLGCLLGFVSKFWGKFSNLPVELSYLLSGVITPRMALTYPQVFDSGSRLIQQNMAFCLKLLIKFVFLSDSSKTQSPLKHNSLCKHVLRVDCNFLQNLNYMHTNTQYPYC